MVFNLHNNWSHKQERVLRKELVRGRNRDCTRQEAFDVGSSHWNSQHKNTQTRSRETLFGFVDRPWDVSISFWPGIELSLNICSKPTDVCEQWVSEPLGPRSWLDDCDAMKTSGYSTCCKFEQTCTLTLPSGMFCLSVTDNRKQKKNHPRELLKYQIRIWQIILFRNSSHTHNLIQL